MKKVMMVFVLVVLLVGCASVTVIEDTYTNTVSYVSKDLSIVQIEPFKNKRVLYLWLFSDGTEIFLEGTYTTNFKFTTEYTEGLLFRDIEGIEYIGYYISPTTSRMHSSTSSNTDYYTGVTTTKTTLTEWTSVDFMLKLDSYIPNYTDIRVLTDGSYDNFEISAKNIKKLNSWYSEIVKMLR